MWLGTVAIRAWKTIFDVARLLKTAILPSRVRFQNPQSFTTIFTLERTLRKLESSFIVLLCEKQVPKILVASLHRSMHLIPQTTKWTPFRAPLPTIHVFFIFGFNLEKTEKVLNSSTR